MNENINTNTPPDQPPKQEDATPMSTAMLLMEKAKPISLNLWSKFYANKKIFWPVTGFFGLVFLIIILGLLFGSKKQAPVAIPKVTSTPFILSTPIASPSSEFLGGEYTKLQHLQQVINDLDVKQSRLQPPALNFEVKF